MILVIDNYDSFSYNLVQMVGAMRPDIQVVRNDAVSVADVLRLHPSHIILSPGPGYPQNAGICLEAARRITHIPMLGVCLGHQAICQAYGARIQPAKVLMHGKASDIHIANGSAIFRGLPPLLRAGRYHSLIAARDSLPDELLVTAEDEEGEVMAIKHRDYDMYGVQFHPESILTPQGGQILRNFLAIGGIEA